MVEEDKIHVIYEDILGCRLHQIYSLASLGDVTGDIEFAKVEAIITNIDTEPHEIGYMLFLDTKINTNDACPVTTTWERADTASVFFSPDVPSVWRAFNNITWRDLIGTGVLNGLSKSEPDAFWFGQWGTAFGNGYDDEYWIEDTGDRYTDSAAMIRWSQVTVAPMDSLCFDTSFGLSNFSTDSFFAASADTMDSLIISDSTLATIICYIVNNCETPMSEIEIDCEIDIDEFELTEFSTPLNSTLSYLHNLGAMHVLTYEIKIPNSVDESSIPYSITIDCAEREPYIISGDLLLGSENIDEDNITPNNFAISAYPNPFNSSCIIDSPIETTAEIFDIHGNLIYMHDTPFTWQPENLPSGIYTVKTADLFSSQKVIYIK